jgi:fructose-bisphosphate aldolase, class I
MLNKLMTRGKSLILAYDQGLEHGPNDFNDDNVHPSYILSIAKKGGFNAIALHKGIAEKYRDKIKIPLILKLNGKTGINEEEFISANICSVDYARKLKSSAVGYTLYIGSKHEHKMFENFSRIQEEARKNKLPVITWIYPRGKYVKNDGKYMAYAARVGLELGADIIKIKYNGNPKDLEWAVDNAGRAKVVVAGGVKTDEKSLLKQVDEIMDAGAIGLAIGRNIWQSNTPLKITQKIKDLIW